MFFPGAPFSRPPREDRKAGGCAELGHLSARALSGFGLRLVAIGTGARGGEIGSFLRLQGRGEREGPSLAGEVMRSDNNPYRDGCFVWGF